MANSSPGMRLRRQVESAMDWTRSASCWPTGWNSSSYARLWRSYRAASSLGSRTVRPVSPVLTALSETFDLPSGVLGPVESWALARLAASCAAEVEFMVVSGNRNGSRGSRACRSVARQEPKTFFVRFGFRVSAFEISEKKIFELL